MCRIFAFRSVLQSQVHRSLLHADNALLKKSEFHPNGWGMAHYLNNVPHLIKSTESAFNDALFARISGIVSSQTVLAHIRNATQGGANTPLNCHPFQYGYWTFIHNGNIQNFSQYKKEILSKIPLHLRKFILGTTDSEVIFYFLLSYIESSKNNSFSSLFKKIKKALKDLTQIIGPLYQYKNFDNTHTFLTFALTDGKKMFTFQGGQSLYYSTYKKSCADKEICPHYLPNCESPIKPGNFINHFIVSSEPLEGENIWKEIPSLSMLGVDEEMIFYQEEISLPWVEKA